jgi:hypothetical protein
MMPHQALRTWKASPAVRQVCVVPRAVCRENGATLRDNKWRDLSAMALSHCWDIPAGLTRLVMVANKEPCKIAR